MMDMQGLGAFGNHGSNVQEVMDRGNILGRAEKEFADEPAGSSEMDRDAFMKLLVAQLENQDPTNPMEDREFVAQMAQFSSLEQLIHINDGMETLNDSQAQDRMLGAVSFMGQELRADGGQISKEGSRTSKIFYELQDDAQELTFDIYNENGRIVDSVQVGARDAGEYELDWDGKDSEEQELPDGIYSLQARAKNEHGADIQVKTDISGQVDGLEMQEGRIVLNLADGREVDLDQVQEVIAPGNNEEE